MNEWKKVKIGDVLTESKIIALDSNSQNRITVRLNCKGIEKREEKAEKEGATKYYKRKAGQFIYGKQNIHKGAFGIIPSDLDGFTSSADLPSFDIDISRCIPDYICYWLKSNDRYRSLQEHVKGAGSQRLAVKDFLQLEIMLPDIDEQKHIVSNLSNKLGKIENLTTENEKQREYIKKLRQSILQDAIEGKLTAEWRKDHPVIKGNLDFDAESLFEKIQQEKQKAQTGKKQKQLPPIAENEKPFEIPDSWKWVRLGEIIEYTENLDIQTKMNDYDLIKYVDIDSIDNIRHEIVQHKEKRVCDLSSRARRVLKKDYILYSNVRPYLCNIAIVKNEYLNYIGSTGFFVFKTLLAKKEFIFFILLSNYIIDFYSSIIQGFNSPSINITQFDNTLIPLSSLKEQEEIVRIIDEKFAKLDLIEQEIKQRESYINSLNQSVMREVFKNE